MVYGYIRVSTEKQSVMNQRYEIENYCKRKGCLIDLWVEETISATKNLNERKLGELINSLSNNDVLIVSELSRLGRNLFQIMSILNYCMEHNVLVITVKENYELGNNINSKVLAFAFGLSAEIERQLISDRTKEALARKRAEGVILGRPLGKLTDITKMKLYPQKDLILEMIQNNISFAKIAKKLCVNRITVSKFYKRLKEEDFI